MAHVVVLGAGLGGMPAAYELRDLLGEGHAITVVNPNADFQFVPSNPWIAVGWREPEEVSFPLEPYLKRRNINFIASPMTKLDADGCRLKLGNGEWLEYDYLVVATGPELAFDEIEGAGPENGYTQSICSLFHAKKAKEVYDRLVEKPGPVVVGAFQGASCFGPAYEFAFVVDSDLKKRKIRHKTPITFVTSEPYIGHLGLGGVGDSKGMLEAELRQRHIQWVTNARVTRVEENTMYVEGLNEQGEVVRNLELPFDFSMMIPAFRGIKPLCEVEEMVNPRGFVKIDDYQRNPAYNNIFSTGVCVAIPPLEATPVPCGVPKTGYMIESMSKALAQNIAAEIRSGVPDAKGAWNAICLADMGDTGVAFVAMPQIPPRNVAWMKKGKWVHFAKVAFEKYFIRKMKKGTPEPVYEKYVLKALGINMMEEVD
ncbi:FAD-dependent oxidoreductase [Sansalvadorimonas sp. 2012CJ34-2]|uniref:FAD-dependent oxidoreductase n=1 Tax=Parendozoicomonas callyspongiae TaxID=2942213 RepID=A0ABT0PHT3_9GAMM|nr:FAD-dependent oxidoreductase [Sansalvadorimonas sp. 2012CJ34-2]MCL6270307.1 FAD-dependent oxidoreductase [Sansalvadorimonas sp. 2012CJ34-2]